MLSDPAHICVLYEIPPSVETITVHHCLKIQSAHDNTDTSAGEAEELETDNMIDATVLESFDAESSELEDGDKAED